MRPTRASRPPESEARLPLGASLLTRVASAGAAFGLHVLLARLAGPDQYGTYSFVLAWLGIAVLVADLGLDLSLVRFVAAYRAQAAWAQLAGLWRWSRRLVLAVACLIGAAAALFLWLARRELDASLVWTGWIACGMLPAAALLRLGEGRLLGLKRVALAQLPEGVVRPAVAAALAIVLFGVSGRALSSPAAMGLHLVAVAVAAGLILALGRRAAPPVPSDIEPRYDRRSWVRVSLPLGGEAGLRLLSNSLDVILLGAVAGMAEAGVYTVASRLAELIVFGSHASQMAARPHIAESHARSDPKALQNSVTAAAGWATLFAALACLLLIPARFHAMGLFGAEFVRGAPVLLILAVGHLVAACTALVDSAMTMTGHQLALARITAGVLALKTPLLLVAIPGWGIEGAALATTATTILGRVWGWAYVRRALDLDGTVLGRFRRG